MYFVSTRRRGAALGFALAIALGFAGACEAPTASNLRSVSVVLGTSALTVPRNDTTTLAVYVVRHNVIDPLDVTAIGLPPGVTIMDAGVDAFVTQGKLLLVAGPSAVDAPDVMIRVSGPGVPPVFAHLALKVR